MWSSLLGQHVALRIIPLSNGLVTLAYGQLQPPTATRSDMVGNPLAGTSDILSKGISNFSLASLAGAWSWRPSVPAKNALSKPLFRGSTSSELIKRDCLANGTNYCFGNTVDYCLRCGTCCLATMSCCEEMETCCGSACCSSNQECRDNQCFDVTGDTTTTTSTSSTPSSSSSAAASTSSSTAPSTPTTTTTTKTSATSTSSKAPEPTVTSVVTVKTTETLVATATVTVVNLVAEVSTIQSLVTLTTGGPVQMDIVWVTTTIDGAVARRGLLPTPVPQTTVFPHKLDARPAFLLPEPTTVALRLPPPAQDETDCLNISGDGTALHDLARRDVTVVMSVIDVSYANSIVLITVTEDRTTTELRTRVDTVTIVTDATTTMTQTSIITIYLRLVTTTSISTSSAVFTTPSRSRSSPLPTLAIQPGTDNDAANNDSLPTSTTIGISVGVGALAALLAIFILFALARHRRRRRTVPDSYSIGSGGGGGGSGGSGFLGFLAAGWRRRRSHQYHASPPILDDFSMTPYRDVNPPTGSEFIRQPRIPNLGPSAGGAANWANDAKTGAPWSGGTRLAGTASAAGASAAAPTSTISSRRISGQTFVQSPSPMPGDSVVDVSLPAPSASRPQGQQGQGQPQRQQTSPVYRDPDTGEAVVQNAYFDMPTRERPNYSRNF